MVASLRLTLLERHGAPTACMFQYSKEPVVLQLEFDGRILYAIWIYVCDKFNL